MLECFPLGIYDDEVESNILYTIKPK